MSETYPDPDECEHDPITAIESDEAPTGSEICVKCGTMVSEGKHD